MLPELFLERMKAQLGEEYPAFLESLERPRAVALRYNPLKGEQPKLLPNRFYLDENYFSGQTMSASTSGRGSTE